LNHVLLEILAMVELAGSYMFGLSRRAGYYNHVRKNILTVVSLLAPLGNVVERQAANEEVE
jgi:hypothetical protein